MHDQVAKAWNLFIHKNLLNPVNVRKQVFQSWLRSRFYNVNPYSIQKHSLQHIQLELSNDMRTFLSALNVYCVYLLNRDLDIVGISLVSHATEEWLQDVSDFRETTIGTTAAILIGESTQVAYTTRYEHYHQALHEFDTVCASVHSYDMDCSQRIPKDLFSILFLCQDFSEVTKQADEICQRYIEMLSSVTDCRYMSFNDINAIEVSGDPVRTRPQSHYLKMISNPFIVYKVIEKVNKHVLEKYNWHIVHFPIVEGSTDFLELIIPSIRRLSVLLVLSFKEDSFKPETIDYLIGIPIVLIVSPQNSNCEGGELLENKEWCDEIEINNHVKQVEIFMQSFMENYNLRHVDIVEENLSNSNINSSYIDVSADDMNKLQQLNTLQKTRFKTEIATNQQMPLTSLKETERNAIIAALLQTQGSKSAAAAVLKISRTTLYRKIQEYDIAVKCDT